eukprot:4113303-Karenia_brevis.AAC.1
MSAAGHAALHTDTLRSRPVRGLAEPWVPANVRAFVVALPAAGPVAKAAEPTADVPAPTHQELKAKVE